MKPPAVRDLKENDDAKKQEKPSKKRKMLSLFKDLCIVFLLTYPAYSFLHNSHLKSRKVPASLPFFGNVNVDDFYQGDLSQLMHEVNTAPLSFVFFYAPWDADCQELKNEFLEAAEFYMDQVYFAGVNCWEPGSECRVRFRDVVERYPQLVAYLGPERAVEYKGPHKADHMIKFLHSILHPIVRLNEINDLYQLRFNHDAVLVGFLHVDGIYDTGLSALYETAVSLASKDYLRRIAVAVFTHTRFNSLMNVHGTPTVHLYVWDKQFEYNGPLKRGALFKWVMETAVSQLVSADGLLLLKPPTVVMFTPMNPLAVLNPSYVMFRRVAMSLKSALTNGTEDEDNFFSYIIKDDPALHNAYYHVVALRESVFRESCMKLVRRTQTCSVFPKWMNNTCTARYPRMASVSEERNRLMLLRQEEECKLLERVAPLPASIPLPVPPVPVNTSFGFACLDSDLFKHLAEALGVDLASEDRNTAIVIIGEEEMTRVPKSDEQTLWSYLKLWADGWRERALRGPWDNKPAPPPQKGRIHLPELSLSSFHQLIQQTQKHGLILYHSRYCGACSRASHVMLELANLLAGVSCLYIARVDGDKVDVPWHFSLHFFPSLLFIPAHKKSESRLFPADTPWVLSALTKFILANVKIEERPEVMLALCGRWGQNPENSIEGSECVRETRKISMEGIATKLRQIKHQRNRTSLLIHLGFLKAVHLALARVTDISKTMAVIKSLSREFKLGCSVT